MSGRLRSTTITSGCSRCAACVVSDDVAIQCLDYLTANFGVNLDQRAEQPVNVVQVVVSSLGSIGAPERATVDYIHSMFAGRQQPDLIVTMAGPAAVSARKYRA